MAAELQRRAGERDQLETMKDEFVLTASHELRSPLTSVQGFAELLMLERDKLSPKQADTVEIILDNTRHLVRLLNDLLDLARSDAGRLTIKPSPADVAPLVEDPVRTMRSQTEAKGQALRAGDRAGPAPGERRPRPDPPGARESSYQRARVLSRRSVDRGHGDRSG